MRLLRDTVLAQFKRINEDNIGNTNGATDLVLTRSGGDLDPQPVRFVWQADEARNEADTASTPSTRVLVVGAVDGSDGLDIKAGDTFALDGLRFRVIGMTQPDDGQQWRKAALAEAQQ